MLYKTYLYKFDAAYRYKNMKVNFSMICLSTGFLMVLKHCCSCDVYPQSAYMYFCGLCCLKKNVISYSKNVSDVKKGEPKKVQVTERLKSVKNHCETKKKRYTSKFV